MKELCTNCKDVSEGIRLIFTQHEAEILFFTAANNLSCTRQDESIQSEEKKYLIRVGESALRKLLLAFNPKARESAIAVVNQEGAGFIWTDCESDQTAKPGKVLSIAKDSMH